MIRAAALACALLLAGCAIPPAQQPAAVSAPAPAPEPAAPLALFRSTADDLVAYMGRLRAMNESQLLAESTRQRQTAARGGGDASRVRAALALSLVLNADDADIVALVEPVLRRENADATLRSMAGFLHALAVDRRRLRESAAAAATRLRDERRAQEQRRQRADAAQERAAQLQQKLDALTEIEKSLTDRQGQIR